MSHARNGRKGFTRGLEGSVKGRKGEGGVSEKRKINLLIHRRLRKMFWFGRHPSLLKRLPTSKEGSCHLGKEISEDDTSYGQRVAITTSGQPYRIEGGLKHDTRYDLHSIDPIVIQQQTWLARNGL